MPKNTTKLPMILILSAILLISAKNITLTKDNTDQESSKTPILIVQEIMFNESWPAIPNSNCKGKYKPTLSMSNKKPIYLSYLINNMAMQFAKVELGNLYSDILTHIKFDYQEKSMFIEYKGNRNASKPMQNAIIAFSVYEKNGFSAIACVEIK